MVRAIKQRPANVARSRHGSLASSDTKLGPVTDYVLATDVDDVERRRMALLFAYHGGLTVEVLEAAGVDSG